MNNPTLPHQFRSFAKSGSWFPIQPLTIERGERIGVVLLSLGEPQTQEDVRPFLLRSRIDPSMNVFQRWWTKMQLEREVEAWEIGFEAVGGGAPFTRSKFDLRHLAEDFLNRKKSTSVGAKFELFLSNSFGPSSHDEVIAALRDRGIRKIVLFPLYPHFGRYTTELVLRHWEEALRRQLTSFETSLIHEYAAHPKYIQALKERIEETLRRFPAHMREDVQVIFASYGTSRWNRERASDPVDPLIQVTVDALADRWGAKPDRHVSCMGGFSQTRRPFCQHTAHRIESLIWEGKRAFLMVPVSFVSERFETAFQLDLVLRNEAHQMGATDFEVCYDLDSHSLFIEALADMVCAKITSPPAVMKQYQAKDWLVRQSGGREIWIQSWQEDAIRIAS